MKLFTPQRGEAETATRELIAEVIARLPTYPAGDQFAILGPDDLTYIQTLLTPDGFVLQYQEGSIDRHFETTRGDLQAAEVIEAFGAYLDGNPGWRWPFEWWKVELRSGFYRLGFLVGRVLGRIFGRTPQ